jgi:signal transduction histidine kinase
MSSLKSYAWIFATTLSINLPAHAAADPAEVDTVVAAVKSANPDTKAMCQKGPDGIRQAMMPLLMNLVGNGKIKSNPQEVGQEAGAKIGKECRGG